MVSDVRVQGLGLEVLGPGGLEMAVPTWDIQLPVILQY